MLHTYDGDLKGVDVGMEELDGDISILDFFETPAPRIRDRQGGPVGHFVSFA